jgi:hypothetical protein
VRQGEVAYRLQAPLGGALHRQFCGERISMTMDDARWLFRRMSQVYSVSIGECWHGSNCLALGVGVVLA